MGPLHRVWRSIGFTLGGFVAGEGSFASVRRRERFVRDGSVRLRFVFAVSVASRDRHLLEALAAFLGHGSINDAPARRAHYQPMSTFTISSMRSHHCATIPFAETFLLRCHKRRQFEVWRDALRGYEAHRPTQYGRGRSECSMPECNGPVRGRSLCRSHYYRATGY
jgi:hypothetical protein